MERTKKIDSLMCAIDLLSQSISCRKIYHYYIGDSTYEGLKTYVFSGTKESMDNGSLVNDFKCYCKDNHCPPAGAFSLEKCQKGAPIFISQAHFMHADPYYRNSIEGMNPDPSKHTSFMALEPVSKFPRNKIKDF